MSEEDVEKFRRGFAAVIDRDLDGFLADVAPDVEFTSFPDRGGGRETFHGHDGVRRWWKEVVLALGGLHGGPDEVRDLGDTVLGRVVAIVSPKRGRGAPDVLVRDPLLQRDGDVVGVLPHRGRAAFEAAGLSE